LTAKGEQKPEERDLTLNEILLFLELMNSVLSVMGPA
jgi:hypothetical protein